MAKKKAKKAKAKTPKKVARTVTRKAPKRKAAKARPASKAVKTKASARKATKKVGKKTAKKAVKKPVRKPVRKPVAKRRAKAVPKPKSTARRAVKAPPKKAAKASKPKSAPKPKVAPRAKAKAAPKATPALPPVPTRLMRERKRLPEVELEDAFVGTGEDDRLLRSARSGHDEQQSELHKRNVPGVELTAGDVDANWEDAYAIGDEAPGGDSPTPDQDRVDDIGKALGVQYDDDEELMGGAEIEERDAHRWELDPKSKNKDEI